MTHPATQPSPRLPALVRLLTGGMALWGACAPAQGAKPVTPAIQMVGQPTARLSGTLYDYRIRSLRGLDTSVYFPFTFQIYSAEAPGLFAKRLDGTGRPVWSGAPLCKDHPDTSRPCENPLNAPDRWFASRPGKNLAVPFSLPLDGSPEDTLRYLDSFFFPLDTLRYLPGTTQSSPFFDQQLGQNLENHNFGFCLELHGQVQPQAGGKLSITADDDTWVFVDSQLVVDMGGLHPTTTQRVPLEPRSGAEGRLVPLDIFHCDRITNESMFGISLNVPVEFPDTSGEPPISRRLPLPLPSALALGIAPKALSVTAPAGQAWTLELRGLDGRLRKAVAGSGATMVPWTNSGVTLARLRSGGETVVGRFAPAR